MIDIKRLRELRKHMLDTIVEVEEIMKDDPDEYRAAIRGWLGDLHYSVKEDFTEYIRQL